MNQGKLTMAWSGRHAVVTLPAEIDAVNSADVADLLSGVAGQRPEVITGDLSGTAFCDSAGVHAIARAHERAAASGVELRLVTGDSPVARILQLAGLDQVIPVYREVQQSLDTAPAGASPPPGEQPGDPGRGAPAGRDVLAEMQHALLPAALPVLPQARIAACYLMAGQDQAAGGDWFDAVPLPGGSVALAVGDVVGHGVAAAAAMGQLRAALNELLTAEPELTTVLARADAFAARTPALSAATLALAVLHPGDGRLQYATCGQPPPLIVSPAAAPRFLPGTGAGPLGTGTRPGARPVLASAQLQPGELVLLYTNGLIARPGRTPLEGMAELAKVAADAAAGQTLPADLALTNADRVSQLTAALLTRSGYADDVTTLTAERHSAGFPGLHLDLPGEVGTVRAARRAFSDWLSQLDPLLLDQDALLLATTEIVTNAVEHAYSAGPPGPVEFHARLGADGQLECRVADHGTWQVPDPGLPWRGQGLMVAAHLVDQLQVQHPPQSAAEARGARGTVVTLRHRLRRPAVLAAEPAVQVTAYAADPPFSVTADLDGPAAQATVSGPVDISTAGRLAGQLLAASRGGTLPLTVDLSAVTQLASAGVRALYQVKQQLNDYHQELTLVATPGSLADAVLSLAGLPVASANGRAMERPPGG
jgi:anti-anti-sigma factor